MYSSISPNKTNIQEANKHLQMVHNRVEQLERALSKQASDFSQRESDQQIHFEELIKIKDAEVTALRARLKQSELVIGNLTNKLKESGGMISQLNDKSRVLDQMMQCKPILESMVNLMGVYQSYKEPVVLPNGVQDETSNTTHQNPVQHEQSVLQTVQANRSDTRHFSVSEDDSMDEIPKFNMSNSLAGTSNQDKTKQGIYL